MGLITRARKDMQFKKRELPADMHWGLMEAHHSLLTLYHLPFISMSGIIRVLSEYKSLLVRPWRPLADELVNPLTTPSFVNIHLKRIQQTASYQICHDIIERGRTLNCLSDTDCLWNLIMLLCAVWQHQRISLPVTHSVPNNMGLAVGGNSTNRSGIQISRIDEDAPDTPITPYSSGIPISPQGGSPVSGSSIRSSSFFLQSLTAKSSWVVDRKKAKADRQFQGSTSSGLTAALANPDARQRDLSFDLPGRASR